MPNPLINAAYFNRKQAQAEHTQEHGSASPADVPPPAQVFPYRGIEDHGVPAKVVPFHEDIAEIGEPVYVEEAPEPDPIPVKVVTEGRREKKDFSVRREYASGNSSRIVNRHNNRTALRITNLGAVKVYVAPEDYLANSMFGYPIAAGAEFSLNTGIPDSDIWVRSDDATQQPLAIIEEFVTDN